MNWFTWEQHKKWFLIAGICLALFGALLIPTGISFWHIYQQARATCGQTNTCSQLSANLLQSGTDQLLLTDIVPDTILFLPILFGIFWGVPLIAKEYAEGTNLLVWTRSVSRRRWLTMKLIWILVATAVFSAAFAALVTWWSKTPNALNLNRFETPYFSIQGIVPVAYSVFAVALGIMFGAWFKRLVPALGATLVLLIVVVLIVVPNFVRPHYMTPLTVTAPMNQNALNAKIPSGAWVLSHNSAENNDGRVFSDFEYPDFPPQCQALVRQEAQQAQVVGAKIGSATITDCLNTAGFHSFAKYQPADRYWEFQAIEAGLYLALSAIPIGATYWLVLKRDA